MEWKIDYQTEENIPAIRRTGKFGIGVLASFLIGDSIEVVTRRYNETIGYRFNADLTNEFIEILKDNCKIGTTINIKLSKAVYQDFSKDNSKLTKWYLLNFPKISYSIDDKEVDLERPTIALVGDKQFLEDSIRLDFENFDDIIWNYKSLAHSKSDLFGRVQTNVSINGIVIPEKYYYQSSNVMYEESMSKRKSIYDKLDYFPFVHALDRNNLIDLELSRNAIRGDLPFITQLVESCKLDFLYKLLFFVPPVEDSVLDFNVMYSKAYTGEYELELDSPQFNRRTIFTTNTGYFLDNSFYNIMRKGINHFKVYVYPHHSKKIKMLDDSTYSLIETYGMAGEQNIIRGGYHSYVAISDPSIYLNNCKSTNIAKHIRENLTIVKQVKDYIVFKRGEAKRNYINDLRVLFKENNAVAVQLSNTNSASYEVIGKLLKEHFFEPKLIPIDYDEKIKYIKTLSKELQKHIVEKRGIRL